MYDPKFSQKQMYDQYGRSRNTTTSKPNPGKQFADSMKAGGGGRNMSGIGAKPPSFGGGQDNNPNRDESENKSTVAKVYEKAVDLFKSFGAKEPEALIVDGKRVYQGPAFRGYDPTTRIGDFGGEYGKKNYFLGMESFPTYPRADVPPTLPPSTINIFGTNTDNPRLNMFGVNRSFTQPPDALELSVSPDIPANMDTITRNTDSKIRGITKGIMTQLPPTAEYRVDEGESLLTVVETLNAGKPTSQHVTLEEIGELNDIPNAVGDPFGKIKKGDVLRVPVKEISPTEFMDNETKAMLREATPTKANFITESLSSLTGKLSNATKDLVNSYTTSTTKGLGTKDTSTYKVERGDTMYDIAKRKGVTLDKLMEANPDVDADRIGVDQVINVPKGADLNDLPPDVQAEVATAINNGEIKTKEQLTLKLYDASTFKGIPPIRQGENLINYFARSGLIGADEADPKFQESFKGWGSGINPSKTPWCADLLGSLILKSGGSIPSRAMEYRPASQNYEFLGETIYNHNPTTGKTYSGKPSDVKAGDILVFNNRLDGTRQSNGDFKYPNKAKGKGHITVVLEVRDDGSIVAIGGNQSADAISYVTGRKSTGGLRASVYTPEIMKKHYKGGFKINRLTDASLTQADPETVAAIINDAGLGGDGQ